MCTTPQQDSIEMASKERSQDGSYQKAPGGRAQLGNSATPHSDLGLSDTTIIDYMRRHPTVSVADLVEFTGVTATAVRQRLGRLMDQGWVARQIHRVESSGRGRPTYRYCLTHDGNRSSGSNYEELASVLWSEIRAIQNPEIRRGLLQRIVARLVENYRDHIDGNTLRERMNSLVALLEARDIPFVVDVTSVKKTSEHEEPNLASADLASADQASADQASADQIGVDQNRINLQGPIQEEGTSQLPILTALACPYPDLAEQDRMVCAFEKMLFSEILGEGLRLTACRLDGDTCCTFEAHASN